MAARPQQHLEKNVEIYAKRDLKSQASHSWCAISEIPTAEEILTPVDKYYEGHFHRSNIKPLSSSNSSSSISDKEPETREADEQPWRSDESGVTDAWKSNEEPASGELNELPWGSEESGVQDAWSSIQAPPWGESDKRPWGSSEEPAMGESNERPWASCEEPAVLDERPWGGESAGVDHNSDDTYASGDFHLHPREFNQISGAWPSTQEYLRTHYKLLRADTTTSLRQAVQYVKANSTAVESDDFSNWSFYDRVSRGWFTGAAF